MLEIVVNNTVINIHNCELIVILVNYNYTTLPLMMLQKIYLSIYGRRVVMLMEPTEPMFDQWTQLLSVPEEGLG